MSSNSGNRSSAPRNTGNPLLVGILVGLVVGAGLAAGLAWLILKSPSPYLQKSPVADQPPAVLGPQVSSPVATGNDKDKPRFEFYKVLTDTQDSATIVHPTRSASSAKQEENNPTVGYEPRLLQTGSFQNSADAEKLKAKLALLGIEANIQTATLPDKGVWYRVRTRSFKTEDEVNRTRTFLKQNGVDATPMRAQ